MEVVSRLTIGAQIDGLVTTRRGLATVAAAAAAAAIVLGEILIEIRREVTIGEEEIHTLGAPGAIGLGPDLAVAEVVGAAVVPLVALLDADEGFPAAVGGEVEVIQVGGDGGDLHVTVVLRRGGGRGRRRRRRRRRGGTAQALGTHQPFELPPSPYRRRHGKIADSFSGSLSPREMEGKIERERGREGLGSGESLMGNL